MQVACGLACTSNPHGNRGGPGPNHLPHQSQPPACLCLAQVWGGGALPPDCLQRAVSGAGQFVVPQLAGVHSACQMHKSCSSCAVAAGKLPDLPASHHFSPV